MPVEFLTDEQAASYGKFNEEPTRPELERFFFLDDEDRKLVAKRRGDHNRLGFALQMCTVRYIGRFLPDDPLDVPWAVVEYLGDQLGIEDVSCVKQYTERKPTAYEHAWESGTRTSTRMRSGGGSSVGLQAPRLAIDRGLGRARRHVAG